MNSSRSSSLVVLLLIAVMAVGAAGAVTVEQADAPSETRVGADVTASFTLTDLYSNYRNWTLHGETELTNVTWTVEVYDQAGDPIGSDTSYDGQEFNQSVDIESAVNEVRVSVTGTAPQVGNYTYEPAESFLVTELTLVREGGTSETIQTYDAHHYTNASREARRAIDDARTAIENAGGHEGAERTLQSAVSAYENENFDNAIDLADQAEESAGQAQASQERNQLILMAVGALIVIGVVVGAIVYWRRTRTGSRL